ncbi:hypothetical protein BJ508DRAFT_413013 [Ascobolus immersus RN42]|uniref:Uncharacterized protein n=1 Tax=Ascobolus immersus RN42 TaxID=1160509 RepID=A0A3N4IH26_ASCIM|nr:hypothetical protein BJ508DRAFT_413013 [Ascobolus immersus RN42]
MLASRPHPIFNSSNSIGKRKRGDAEDEAMDWESTGQAREHTGAGSLEHLAALRTQLNARTQKRTRNREDEAVIQARTIAELFSAVKKPGIAPRKSVNVDPIISCDDCEKTLEEWELFEDGEGKCVKCEKRVCRAGGCSIECTGRSGGQGRVCLDCAMH